MSLITPTASFQYIQIFKVFRPQNKQDPTIKKRKITKKEIFQELKNLK